MADIHILEKRPDGQHRLVCHFAVGASENSVPSGAGGPVTYQEAVAGVLGGSPASVLPTGDGTKGTVSAAEAAQIASGEVLERVYQFAVDSGGTTNAERAASIRAFYGKRKAEIAAELANTLEYFGAVLNKV